MTSAPEMDNQEALAPKEKTALVVKGKFKFSVSGIYGIFVIAVNTDYNSSKAVDNFLHTQLLASHFSDMYDTEIDIPWSILSNKFNNLFLQKEYALSVTTRYGNIFNDKIRRNDDFIRSILVEYSENRLEAIQIHVENILHLMSRGQHLDMVVEAEVCPLFDVPQFAHNKKNLKVKEENTEPVEPTEPFELDTESYGLEVPIIPILSPTHGISAYHLTEGQKILVKLDTSFKMGEKWAEVFYVYHKDSNIPKPLLVATIDQILIKKKRVEIVVIFQPHQFAHFDVQSSLKLRAYDPERDHDVFDPAVHLQAEKEIVHKNIASLFKEKGFVYLVVAFGVTFLLTIVTFLYL